MQATRDLAKSISTLSQYLIVVDHSIRAQILSPFATGVVVQVILKVKFTPKTLTKGKQFSPHLDFLPLKKHSDLTRQKTTLQCEFSQVSLYHVSTYQKPMTKSSAQVQQHNNEKIKLLKDLRTQNRSVPQQLQPRFEKHRCLAILIQRNIRRMPRCSLTQGMHLPSARAGSLTYEQNCF